MRPYQRLKHALAFRFCPHPRFRALHPLVLKRLTDCLGQGELRYHYVASQEGRKEMNIMSTYALNRQVEVIALVLSFRSIPVEAFDRIARPLIM